MQFQASLLVDIVVDGDLNLLENERLLGKCPRDYTQQSVIRQPATVPTLELLSKVGLPRKIMSKNSATSIVVLTSPLVVAECCNLL